MGQIVINFYPKNRKIFRAIHAGICDLHINALRCIFRQSFWDDDCMDWGAVFACGLDSDGKLYDDFFEEPGVGHFHTYKF